MGCRKGKVQGKVDSLAKADADAKAKAFEAEKAVNEARIAANAPVVEDAAEDTGETPAGEEE